MEEGNDEASSGDGTKQTVPRFLFVGMLKFYVIGKLEENVQTNDV